MPISSHYNYQLLQCTHTIPAPDRKEIVGYKPKKWPHKVAKKLDPVALCLEGFFSVAQAVANVAERTFEASMSVGRKIAYCVPFVGFIYIPASLCKIYENCAQAWNGSLKERRIALYNTLYEIGMLAGYVINGMLALNKIHVFPDKFMAAATGPLSILSSILSIFGIVEHYDKWEDHQNLLDSIDWDKHTQEDYEKLIGYLVDQQRREKTFIKRHFAVNASKLEALRSGLIIQRLRAMNCCGDDQAKAEAEKGYAEVIRRVRWQLERSILSERLQTLIYTINFAVAPIFAFTPLAFVGYSLMGVSLLLVGVNFMCEWAAKRNFKAFLKTLETGEEPAPALGFIQKVQSCTQLAIDRMTA